MSPEEYIDYLLGIIHNYTIFFLIFDIVFFVAILLVLIFLIKFLKSKEKIRASGDYLRYTIRGMEEERARIARELHDTVAQDLRYCKSLSEKIEENSVKSHVVEILDKSITEVRSMSYNLAPPDITKNDLSANIMNLCKTFSDFAKIEIRYTVPDGLDTHFLSHDDNLNLYRIVQESLNNIHKHACASEVTVLLRNQMRNEEKGLYIFISDDGLGFDTKKSYFSGTRHFGLVGMKQRAELIGAKISITSEADVGTQVSIIKKAE